MIPALGTALQLVAERYDNDTLWLGMGAPARWVSSGPPEQGYGVDGAVTRFGVVSFRATASPAGPSSNASASVAVGFSPSGSPGLTAAPSFVVRLKSGTPGVGAVSLVPSSVVVGGDATLVSVDAAALTATVQLTPGATALGAPQQQGRRTRGSPPGVFSFTIDGEFTSGQQ